MKKRSVTFLSTVFLTAVGLCSTVQAGQQEVFNEPNFAGLYSLVDVEPGCDSQVDYFEIDQSRNEGTATRLFFTILSSNTSDIEAGSTYEGLINSDKRGRSIADFSDEIGCYGVVIKDDNEVRNVFDKVGLMTLPGDFYIKCDLDPSSEGACRGVYERE